MKKLILLAFLLVSISLSANEINKEELIEKMITAYGGEAELKQLNIYEQFWLVEAHDFNSSEYRMVMMPDYLRVKLRYPDKTEIRILDKKNGTIMIGGTIFKAIDSKLDAMKIQMMGLLSPIELKKKLNELELETESDYYLLSLHANSIDMKYYISKETNLLHKSTAKITVNSKEVLLATIYENYKIFNGVMLAYKESRYIEGVINEVLKLQETRFQEPLK